ncbi:MAG: hypothetical protein RJA56_976, partial [Pseudomonadota bacterium]
MATISAAEMMGHGKVNSPWYKVMPTGKVRTSLLELSDTESAEHAQAQLEQLLGQAIEAGCASDAIVASNLAQAQGFWHVRESISMAQAEEGLNIKHDIS